MAFDARAHLTNIRGQEYLEVKWRLVWFREEHPAGEGWGIETRALELTEQRAVWRAEIIDPEGRVVATGTKSETPKGFADYIEKAETGAIGRALALLGYGTQWCADELDEGERIVDSPVAAPRHFDENNMPISLQGLAAALTEEGLSGADQRVIIEKAARSLDLKFDPESRRAWDGAQIAQVFNKAVSLYRDAQAAEVPA